MVETCSSSFYSTGALIITSGLMLNLCVGAMLIIPQKMVPDKNANTKEPNDMPSSENKKLKESSNEVTNDDKEVEHNCGSFLTMTLEIIKRPPVVIMFISTIFFLAGTAVVYTHLLVYAEYQGVPKAIGTLMISCLGVSALAGRLGLSAMSQQHCTDTVLLYIMAIFITGTYCVERS